MSFFLYISLAYGLTFYSLGLIGLSILLMADIFYINSHHRDRGWLLKFNIASKAFAISEPHYMTAIIISFIPLWF